MLSFPIIVRSRLEMSAFVPSTAPCIGIGVSECGTCSVMLPPTSFAGRPTLRALPRRPPPKSHDVSRRSVVTNTITTERLANKSYQLEEDEDAASCATAIYLSEDGTLILGRTDGPNPDRFNATWSFDDSTGELRIDIERYFSGEGGVEFMVKRYLRGHLDSSSKPLEDLPVFTGAMYPDPTDFGKHSEVGWFAMVLATDDLPSESFDISSQ